jgi:hypothetical protein
MSTISLEGSIRSCKVDNAWADKLQSDRFLNPNNMVCPVWNRVDTAGRPVCRDSFYTKSAGCNSAADRVNIENKLRPQYIEYVNLDAAGIKGGLDCSREGYVNPDTTCRQKVLNQANNYTGRFGYESNFSRSIIPNCVSCRKDTKEGYKRFVSVRR